MLTCVRPHAQDAVPDLGSRALNFMQAHVPLFMAPWHVREDLLAAGCAAALVSPASIRWALNPNT